MKLMEFFNHTDSKKKDHKELNLNELFEFIIDHDKLHKDFFFEIANKVKKLKECGTSMIEELYMPMVKKGCKEYYEKNKMQGKLSKVFSEQIRKDLCQKLHDHYYEDIKKGRYSVDGWR